MNSVGAFYARSKTLLRGAFLVAALAAATGALWQHRAEASAALKQISPGDLLLSAGGAAGFVLASYLAWRTLAPSTGTQQSSAVLPRIYFLGQIGKYVPGGIWQFVAAAEIGRDAGFTRRSIVTSFLFALIASLAAGVALALIVLPASVLGDLALTPWAIAQALVPIAVLLIPGTLNMIANLARLDSTPSRAALLRSVAIAFATWLCGGLHIWALTNGLGIALETPDIVTLAGFYAAAWIAGFLVFLAPAGVGVREAALVAMLSTLMPVAQALVIALVSRLLMTLVDFFAAGITLLLARHPDNAAGC